MPKMPSIIHLDGEEEFAPSTEILVQEVGDRADDG